jgi:hypothetical protein
VICLWNMIVLIAEVKIFAKAKKLSGIVIPVIFGGMYMNTKISHKQLKSWQKQITDDAIEKLRQRFPEYTPQEIAYFKSGLSIGMNDLISTLILHNIIERNHE